MTHDDVREILAGYVTRPRGFTAAEVCEAYGITSRAGRDKVSRICWEWSKRQWKGELFSSKAGHRTVRYFGRKEWADAHQAVTPKNPTRAEVFAFRAPRSAPWDPALPPLITPATKFTFAPPPPARVLRTNTYSPMGA